MWKLRFVSTKNGNNQLAIYWDKFWELHKKHSGAFVEGCTATKKCLNDTQCYYCMTYRKFEGCIFCIIRAYIYYILKQIESKYPGLKELLLPCGLSVQAQETHPVRTAIDQRGKQTINRDAKTSGM